MLQEILGIDFEIHSNKHIIHIDLSVYYAIIKLIKGNQLRK